MCGIFFSLSHDGYLSASNAVLACLERRGPDHVRTLRRVITGPASRCAEGPKQPSKYLTFVSTVLCLRGTAMVPQPLLDEFSGSVLCWNGEAWRVHDKSVHGNDSQAVFQMLLQATRGSCRDDQAANLEETNSVCGVISSLSGPYAFVFYDALRQRLYYGRDALGRRSLVTKKILHGTLIISSVCDGSIPGDWQEVEADGLHILDMNDFNITKAMSEPEASGSAPSHIPWSTRDLSSEVPCVLQHPFQPLNKSLPGSNQLVISLNSLVVLRLAQELSRSLSYRVKEVPDPLISTIRHSLHKEAVSVSILFSGGLDCTILARLVHDLLPREQSIDLLNVAFENPRVVAAAASVSDPELKRNTESLSPYSLCPDRNTGFSSHEELCRVCPGRTWRFVCIDIPYAETLNHRAQVKSLISPHNTEMDISIAYAFYFAARGSGTICDEATGAISPYTTSARVLISGLGADELFAGYTRHATAFSRRGYPGLLNELELDFNRLGKRNLGRDDRVISHWGKEARYPYLDETLVSWALTRPVWEKCGFEDSTRSVEASSRGDLPMLEPGKKLLRLLAWKLGMSGVAVEKKRAIQFGARTAKMERGKTKGTEGVD